MASNFQPICRDAIFLASTPNNLALVPSAVQCDQFVNGVLHGIAALSSYSRIDLPFCPTGPLTTGTVITIWMKFMDENPKDLDALPAGRVLLAALVDAQPCR